MVSVPASARPVVTVAIGKPGNEPHFARSASKMLMKMPQNLKCLFFLILTFIQDVAQQKHTARS